MSVYIVFGALALHWHPHARENLRRAPANAELFAEEVRRFFPFFPSVIARVRNDTFVPQGGGDHYVHHRCPGEWITVELMKVAALFLAQAVQYDVPQQDLRIAMTRLPALPRSGFVISNVRVLGDRK